MSSEIQNTGTAHNKHMKAETVEDINKKAYKYIKMIGEQLFTCLEVVYNHSFTINTELHNGGNVEFHLV